MLSPRQIVSIFVLAVFLAATARGEAADNTSRMNIGKTVSIDPRSGAPAVNVPLQAPSGRGGVGPSLVLSYAPTNGNGPVGWGWALELGGSVTRAMKKGAPAYDSTDDFVGQIGGKSYDLVSIGNGVYRPKVEGDYVTFTFASGAWQAQDMRGTIYYFGSRTGSTVTDGTRVFRWKLDRVKDIFGNVMVIDHKADGAFEIRYSLAAGKNPDTDIESASNFAYRIVGDIETTDRPDVMTGYKTGFAITERRRLASMSIYGGGQMMRKYAFQYRSSPRTARSELLNVVEIGVGGSMVGDAVNFVYNDSATPTYTVKSLKDPQAGDNLWNCQWGGGYDRGHDNYGPVPGFDTDMGTVYTQASGSGVVTWSSNSKGRLTFSSGQDTACQCWTYAYVSSDKTITLSGTTGGEWGIYLNGSTTVNRTSMALKAGYNLIVLTDYHQHESFTFDLGFDLASQVGIMSSTPVMTPQITGDFDGDGMADVAAYSADTGTIKVMRIKSGAYLPQTTWIDGFAMGGKKLLLGDFNADGRIDVASYDSAADELRIAYSDGSKFNLNSAIIKLGKSGDVFTADMNGDGFTDIYVLAKTATGKEMWLAKNNKNGTFTMASSATTLYVGGPDDTVYPADINGDGLTDLIGFNKAAGTWYVHLNTNGFNNTQYYSLTGFAGGQSAIAADFNNDGRTDIGYYDFASKSVIYRPSTNNGFGSTVSRALGFTITDTNAQFQVADFNGDGLVDYSVFMASGVMDIAYSTGPAQDVLTAYMNNAGGQVSLGYVSSTKFVNKYMPFAMPVINSVTVYSATPGNCYPVTTSYSYGGGYWNVDEREFYGFETAKIFTPTNYTFMQFDQSNIYLRGRVKRVAVYGASGKLYREAINQWSLTPVVSGRSDIQFPTLTRTDNLVYNVSASTPTGIRSAVETTYDATTGVPLEVKNYGEVDFTSGNDIGNDFIKTVNTYASNSSLGILSLPTSSITYDNVGSVLSKEWVYYDGSSVLGSISKGLPTKKTVWNKSGSTESTASTEITYNAYGLPLTSKDALGATASTEYDSVWAMFPMSTTNAKGMVARSEFYGVNGIPLTVTFTPPGTPQPPAITITNPWGVQKATIDANNQRSSVIYDPLGRVLAEIGPLDSEVYPTTIYNYLYFGSHKQILTQRLIEHGKAGTLDTITYVDGLGRVMYTRSPWISGQSLISGVVRYDASGRVSRAYQPYISMKSYPAVPDPMLENLDPEPRSRTGQVYAAGKYFYDELGRVTQTYVPGTAISTSYSYSPTSVTVIDPNGHKNVAIANAHGRIIKVEEYSGVSSSATLYASTNYEYDIKGNLTKVLDSAGSQTTITYDALNQKTEMRTPDTGLVRYAYDAVGQMLSQTDAKNVTLSYTYDEIGRTMGKSRSDVSGQNVTYSYDTGAFGIGKLATAGNSSGNTNFVYDAIGAEVSATKVIDSKSYTLNKTFDAIGRIKQVQYPDGKSTAVYLYNTMGLLSSVQLKVTSGGTTTTQNIISNVDYLPTGKIATISYGNGAIATYAYDTKSLRVTSQKVTGKTGTVLQQNLYSYDASGNVTQIQDTARGKTQTFAYDSLDRMISSNDGSGAITYAYDSIGNIVQKGNIAYTYGENGAGVHAVTSLSDGTRMSYDANGNMTVMSTPQKTTFYSYDAENRLTKIETQDAGTTTRNTVAEYFYDGDGGRAKKTVYTANGPVTTYLVGDIFDEVNGVKTDYLFMGGSRVAAYDGGKVRWFIENHLGSASAVLDETSALKERIDYSPWGEVINYEKFGNTQEVAWFYFTGKKMDDESGLVYFGARYYNPKLGRFITADSIVQAPYVPQTLNRYTYCNNNPVSMVDPTGHSIKSFFEDFGDFFSPLGRAIVTGDWGHFGQQVLNIAGIVVGVMTQNWWLVASSALSYFRTAIETWNGSEWATVREVMGYAALACAVVGVFSSPGTAASTGEKPTQFAANFNSDSVMDTGRYAGYGKVVELDPIVITKTASSAGQAAQVGRAASALQTLNHIVGMIQADPIGTIRAVKTGMDVAQAGSLGLMYIDPPVGALAFGMTGLVGTGLGYADAFLSHSIGKGIMSTAELAVGSFGGEAAMGLAKASRSTFDWGVMRYRSSVGRFISDAAGNAALGWKSIGETLSTLPFKIYGE